ncbi:Wzz/FepE/Etk N-terminal domain-containing protein [Pseudonocardia zijingensis]|uniref:Polysaccharide biosynthesis tyrosine autokinase n=1 Tax=Pseudonocardia zijingensis TaxID=153376 RepID=A0ABN1NJD8_9PSEU
MTLREYVNMVRTHWRPLLAGLLVGLIGAVALYLVTPVEYSARTTVFVSARAGLADASSAYEGNLLSAQRMTSYVEVVRSHRMATEVVAALGLPDRPTDLARRVSATTAPESVLLTISVTDPSPTRAADIANAVANRFVIFVTDLEQPADPAVAPPLGARVFEPAAPPLNPATPPPWVYVGSGLAVGLLIGVLAAAARRTLDRRARSAGVVAEALSAPVLASVPAGPTFGERLPALRAQPLSLQAESFRRLRVHLQSLGVGVRRRMIVVTSPTPDPESARTSCELAAAMTESIDRVLLVEADGVRPRLAACLGLPTSPGLAGIVTGQAHLADAVQHWEDGGLDVLQIGPTWDERTSLLAARAVPTVLESVRAQYDLVLVIAPPVLSFADTAPLAARCDAALLVVRHGRTTTDDLEATAAAFTATGAHLLGAVVTRVPARTAARGWTSPQPRVNGGEQPPPFTPAAPPANGSRVRPSPRPRSQPRPSAPPPS